MQNIKIFIKLIIINLDSSSDDNDEEKFNLKILENSSVIAISNEKSSEGVKEAFKGKNKQIIVFYF